MKRHIFSLFAALALTTTACRPTTGGASPDGSGSGGGDAAASSLSASTSASSGGAPACITSTPRARPDGWRCARATDCYDGSPCTDDVCSPEGACSNPVREGGCDAAEGWHGVCVGGACCPRDGVATPVIGPR